MEKRAGLKSCTLMAVIMLCMMMTGVSSASDTLCAKVKIEIQQELTLERQAFEAHMKINNGLTGISLEDVDIDVNFADADGNPVLASTDPQNLDAKFFIKVDSMNGISDVDGGGTVNPSSSADIYWLIIPAQDASNGIESGTLYYVGATLTYTIGGEENITEVSPDYIYVKPMPNLILDYFLPVDVYGDDPLTPEIEEIIPFSLGVRVNNSGYGTAKNLKIDSAQPKIVENEQGLLIGFLIEGSQVQGQEEEADLLVDFGDIAPNSSKMARWKMICTLSGKFVSFDAVFSHSDELGGELTSLLEEVNTHILIREVISDLPGRDGIWDFLAKDGDVIHVYESNSTTSSVTDFTSSSSIALSGQVGTETIYDVTAPVSAGFSYIRLTDPGAGQSIIKRAVRSDGKQMLLDNVWLHKSKNDNKEWEYYLNIFDANSTGKYSIYFEDAALMPQAPNIQFIPDKTGVELQQLGFLVEASDPNGDITALSASPLPAGAIFTDNGNGEAIFDWTPSEGQAGTYIISFRATDGSLTDKRNVVLTINSASDTDGDGITDTWETAYFGNLDRDGTGDYDGDGVTDLDEFLLGTDPNYENKVPGLPVIISPVAGDEAETLALDLIIENSSNSGSLPVVYEYELFSDKEFRERVSSDASVTEGDSVTVWTVPQTLSDNTTYYWRVRAETGGVKTDWVYSEFFVNMANEAPGVFGLSYPSDGTSVDTLTPVLESMNATDPDGDTVTYRFELFTDTDLNVLVANSADVSSGEGKTEWTVSESLADNSTYYWRVTATDEHGLQTVSGTAIFSTDTGNEAPSIPQISFPGNNSILFGGESDLVVENSTDPEDPTLFYYFEVDTVKTFDSGEKITSGQIDEGDTTTTLHVDSLDENRQYYWRVKASDGTSESRWSTASFLMSTVNDAPDVPVIKNPGDYSWLNHSATHLAVHPANDPEDSAVSYRFEIYAEPDFETLLEEGETTDEIWPLSIVTEDCTRYYWRALAMDEEGIVSEWSPVATFIVKESAVPETVVVTVTTDSGTKITGKTVYAFTTSESYTGLSALTDDTGVATFNAGDFTENVYKFRVEYLGTQFWSGDTAIPGIYEADIEIIEESVNLNVTTAAGPASGVRVYLFSESGTYLGSYYQTDANGQISLLLPVGQSYQFRVDMSGHQYWSDVFLIEQGGDNTFSIMTGGGDLSVNVQEAVGVPMEGIRVYLFNNQGSYLSRYLVSDTEGHVVFDLPSGGYNVRADYLGYQFWSGDIDVQADTAFDLNIPHTDVTVSANGSFDGTLTPLSSINLYLFTPSDAYVNWTMTTNDDGEATFHLPEKAYKIRADYMNSQFWSDEFTWSDPDVVIPMADVNITVGWSNCVLEGVRVYLFTGGGTYLNMYCDTGSDGVSSFRIPADVVYKFRADYQSSQYWSADITPIADQQNSLPISTGGGTFIYTVMKSEEAPLEGVNNHIFSENGSYFGVYGPTNSDGQVSFDLADSNYNIRTDYLGYQFWSPVYSVPDTLEELFTILHSDVTISVNSIFDSESVPLTAVPVYLFTPSGTYVNMTGQTDEQGQLVFNLPDSAYKVRADYMGQEFWSDEFISADTNVDIPMADAEVSVTWDGGPVEGVSVYAFTPSGIYLNTTAATDATGKVVFRIPAGDYIFRADYLGSQFWSEEAILQSDQVTSIEISTGGGPFVLTVLKDATTPLEGVTCYVFNDSGTYLSLQSTTSSEGQVTYDLAQGSYQIRIDYLGYQFWAGVYNIPGALSETFTIPHVDVAVAVNTTFNFEINPLSGVTAYLFTEAGAYQNIHGVTDPDGMIIFSLPQQAYKVRVDYMNGQFWSDAFNQTDTVVDIAMAEASVSVSGAGHPLENVTVYAYTESGTYLSLNSTTDATGTVGFRLPSAGYKFRADYQSKQFWSPVSDLAADVINPVSVDTGGGTVSVTLRKNTTESLENVTCYVFTETGTFIGLFATTDSTGTVTFDLSDGNYKIRADYMGYQFWSDPFIVPNVLDFEWTIPHSDITATVEGYYDTSYPMEGVPVYLFSESDAYMGITASTDVNGNVMFSLPDMGYKLRANYLGGTFWSEVFTGADIGITILKGRADVTVTRSGSHVENATVYLFLESGSYLSLNQTTDSAGNTVFEIPESTYLFRIDEGGDQVWSDTVTVTSGATLSVNVDME